MRAAGALLVAAFAVSAGFAQVTGPTGPGGVKMAEMRTLKVAVTGGGSVAWQGGGCAPKPGQNSAFCTVPMLKGRTVAVTAKAPPGARLDGWSGACDGSASCQFVMDSDRDLVASFGPDLYRVRVAGPAGATLTLDPAGDKPACEPNAQYGKVCRAFFAPGTQVNVTAGGLSDGAKLMGPGCPNGATRCRVTVSQDVDLCVRSANDPNVSLNVGPASGLPAGGCRIK
jgi:hypothetical protein